MDATEEIRDLLRVKAGRQLHSCVYFSIHCNIGVASRQIQQVPLIVDATTQELLNNAANVEIGHPGE